MASLPKEIGELISEYHNAIRIRDGYFTFFTETDKQTQPPDKFEGKVQVKSGLWHSMLGPLFFSLGNIYQPLILHHQDFDITTLPPITPDKKWSDSTRDTAIGNNGTLSICSGDNSLNINIDVLQFLPSNLRTSHDKSTPCIIKEVWASPTLREESPMAIVFLLYNEGFYLGDELRLAFLEYIDKEQRDVGKVHGYNERFDHEEAGTTIHTNNARAYLPTLTPDFDGKRVEIYTWIDPIEVFTHEVGTEASIPAAQAGPFIQQLHPLAVMYHKVAYDNIFNYPWIYALQNIILQDPGFRLYEKVKIISRTEYVVEK